MRPCAWRVNTIFVLLVFLIDTGRSYKTKCAHQSSISSSLTFTASTSSLPRNKHTTLHSLLLYFYYCLLAKLKQTNVIRRKLERRTLPPFLIHPLSDLVIMYTDTKNLANLCVNNTNALAKMSNHQQQEQLLQQQSDKFKLKKVWKPILRLMSLKTASAGKNRSIPNNVNLNNAQITHSTPKDLLFSSEEHRQEQEEESSTTTTPQITHKLPEFWHPAQEVQRSECSTISSKQPLEFISRVSVEKTPINTCNNCIHGRNCQHSQYHQMEEMSSSSSSSSITSQHNLNSHPLLQEDLNFISAEDGCFVWSDSSADIDEQLLRQWFWQNSWQFAENATVC